MSVATQFASRPRRRVHSDAFKCRVVELSLVPGASVSAIALEHGINANLLFGWRKVHVKSQAALVSLIQANEDVGLNFDRTSAAVRSLSQ